MNWFRLFLLPAIIGVGVLLSPWQAVAQKGGGGRGGGSGHAPSASGAHAHPGGAYHSGASRGIYGYGYGYGGLGFGYPYSSLGYGYPFGYGGIGLGSSAYNSYYPPIINTAPLFPPPTIVPAAPANNNEAQIEVRLPVADASITLNDDPTQSTGTQRFFNTPPLQPGFAYSYQIVATWMQGAERVRIERTIQVAPGRTTLVDFTRTNIEPRMPPVEP